MKPKTNKSISIFDKKPKERRLYEWVEEVNSWRDIPFSKAQQNKLYDAIYEWSTLPTSRSFEQFLDERGIHDNTWDNWRKAYPDVQQAYEHALRHIGVVRENGMADHRYDGKTYAFTQRCYSKRWRDAQDLEFERRKALGATTQQPTAITIQMQDFDAPLEDSISNPNLTPIAVDKLETTDIVIDVDGSDTTTLEGAHVGD